MVKAFPKLTILFILPIVFLLFANIVSAKYCNWDVELFSVKDISPDKLDLSNLDFTSNLIQSFSMPLSCNITSNSTEIQNFINSAKIFRKIDVIPYLPLNETNECFFVARSSNNVTIAFENGFMEFSTPIDGCYDGIPPYPDAFTKVYDMSQLANRKWDSYLFILHLDLNSDEYAISEISGIKSLLINSQFSNITDLDVGVPELFATSRYYPYAGETNGIPLVLAVRGSPALRKGGYSSVWDIPISFYKMTAINKLIIEKINSIDKSLDSDLHNLTQLKNEASTIFQIAENTKNFEGGKYYLENISYILLNFNSSSFNATELDQINKLIFLEQNELQSPDINQNKFSIYYFRPPINKQINTMQQIIQNINDKQNKIEIQKEQYYSVAQGYMTDLSIFQSVDLNNQQINISIIAIVLTISISIIFSVLADGPKMKKNIKNFYRRVSHK